MLILYFYVLIIIYLRSNCQENFCRFCKIFLKKQKVIVKYDKNSHIPNFLKNLFISFSRIN